MGFGAGQIVTEDDLALFIARETYQELTTVSVVASTAFVDIPGSTINVIAGATYWVDVWVAYDGPTAGDAKFAWTTSDADIGLDRNCMGPALTINATTGPPIQGNLQIPDMLMIRRGTTTAVSVGTPNAVANAFTIYHETAILKSTAAADGTAVMRFGQNAASGTSLVQSGYMKITRVA
jgi:hypothetical protein